MFQALATLAMNCGHISRISIPQIKIDRFEENLCFDIFIKITLRPIIKIYTLQNIVSKRSY